MMRPKTAAAFAAMTEIVTVPMTVRTEDVTACFGVSETTIRRYADETGIEIHSVYEYGWIEDEWYYVRTNWRTVTKK